MFDLTQAGKSGRRNRFAMSRELDHLVSAAVQLPHADPPQRKFRKDATVQDLMR
jgi:hypothetical protein